MKIFLSDIKSSGCSLAEDAIALLNPTLYFFHGSFVPISVNAENIR
ncbi:hypothetical protein [Nostoc sp. 106C]|nr:hypothetical protein [Nostoc sp. 106C]